MRISDWSSDVCSSDLLILPAHARCHAGVRGFMEPLETCCATVSRGSQLFEAPFTVLSCASSWPTRQTDLARSEEHTSELQSLMRISYAVFCLKKKKKKIYIASTAINISHHKRI